MRPTGNIARGWRQVVTLICLCTFMFVAAVHAGQHYTPGGEQALHFMKAAGDGGDANGEPDNDGLCLLCVMAMDAAQPIVEIPLRAAHARVEFRNAALFASVRPAELPPPIA